MRDVGNHIVDSPFPELRYDFCDDCMEIITRAEKEENGGLCNNCYKEEIENQEFKYGEERGEK